MTPPNERVSDGDKRRARQIVDQGLAAGRIIQADRDKRIEQIDNAQSVDELRMLTHDLDRSAMFGGVTPSPSPVAPPPPPPPPPMPVPAPGAPVAPTPNVPYGPPVTMSQESISEVQAAMGSAAKKSGRSCLGCLIPLFVVLVFGGTSLAVFSDVRDAVEEAFDSASENGGLPGISPEKQEPDVLSVGGWNDLESALRERTGSTEAFSLVLYPTYAVVTAPVDRTSGRSQSLYWDGEFGPPGTSGTSMQDRFDLADLRPGVVIRLVARARKLVENPTTWYAIVHAPDLEGTSIMAYASNEFQETAYIAATADGKVIRRLVP